MPTDSMQINIEAINHASGELRKITNDLRSLEQHAGIAGGGMAKAGSQFDRTFAGIAKGALAVGAGIVSIRALEAGLRGTGGAAIAFEDSFAGIRKTVDATEQEFDALAHANRQMAKQMPISIAEINRIGESAGALGISGVKNIENFERTIATLAITTNLTADEAASAFGHIAASMDLETDDLDRLGAAVVDLGNKGASTEREIVDFLSRIAGAGKLLGIGVDELAGLSSAFASVGIEAEAGGTAVQKVFLELQQAAATGNDSLTIFAATAGRTVDEFRNLVKEDPSRAFTLFVEGLGKAGDDAIRALQALGLEDQRLIRSFLTLAGAGDTLTTQIEIGTQAYDDNTAAAAELEKRTQTTASQIQLLKNNFNDLGISIGTYALPLVNEFVEGLNTLVDAAPGAIGSLRGITDAFWGLGDAIGNIPTVRSIRNLLTEGGGGDEEPGAPPFVDRPRSAIDQQVIDRIHADAALKARLTELQGDIPANLFEIGGLVSGVYDEIRATSAAAREATPDLAYLAGLLDTQLGPSAGKGAKEIDILADGVITFAEAAAAGLDAPTAAGLEMEAALARAAAEGQEYAFGLAKQAALVGDNRLALLALGNEMLKAGGSYADLMRVIRDATVRNLEDAVAGIESAFSGLFGKPTREGADLDVQIAERELALAEAEAAGASDKKIERIRESIEALRRERRVLDANSDLYEARFRQADQTLLTEEEQAFAAALYTIALQEGSLTLDALKDQQGLEAIARSHLIDSMLNASEAYNSVAGISAGQSNLDFFNSLPGSEREALARLLEALASQGRLAGGTDYWRGGPALVGERGMEIVNIPRGSQVIPADETRKMLNAGEPVVNNYYNPTIIMQGDPEAALAAIGGSLG